MTHPNLFNAADQAPFIARLQKLKAETPSFWGKMTATQMVVHMQRPFQVAFGELELKRSLFGFLFGKMIKKSLLAPKPFSRNAPTSPAFIVDSHDYNFEKERQKLLEYLKRLLETRPADLVEKPHAFFGKMTAQEWNTIQVKHLDHHLQQFGL